MKQKTFDRLDRKFWHRYLLWLAASSLVGCANAPVRDYPHGPRCKTDGTHKHVDSARVGGE